MNEEDLDKKIAEIEGRYLKVRQAWYSQRDLYQIAGTDIPWLLEQLKLLRKALKKAVSDHVSQFYDELDEPRQTERRIYALLEEVAE